MSENFIRIYDDVLSSEFCTCLIQKFEGFEHRAGRVGPGHIKPSIKQTSELWLSKKSTEWKDEIQTLDDAAMGCVKNYITSNYPVPDNDWHPIFDFKNMASTDIRIKKYDPGNYHDWHSDSGHTKAANSHWILAVQFYFNTVEDGGETAFSVWHDEIKVKPVQGRIAVFPTFWMHPHKGMAPISGPKYSGNMYLLDNLDKRNLYHSS